MPGGVPPTGPAKDGAGTFRESRGKAKQYTTINGRTVIVKDNFVYTNKGWTRVQFGERLLHGPGFRILNQCQLLSDSIYYPDSYDSPPWLIYYISKPVIGTCETIKIVPATLDKIETTDEKPPTPKPANGASSSLPRKKEVNSFNDLLNNFPMIARQMQPGLDRLFKELGKEFEKPLPALPTSTTTPISVRRRSSVSSSTGSLSNSFHSSVSNGSNGAAHDHHRIIELNDEEEAMRTSTETAVTAAIDLFQGVDKSQLSLLGATTNLTGTMVEKMIERYVTENIHDSVLFPKLTNIRGSEDTELDTKIRQMSDIDVSQVGLSVGKSRYERHSLSVRLSKGVEAFKKMGVASSPQEMLEILLQTLKLITSSEALVPETNNAGKAVVESSGSEKQDALLTINADTLVSLLLIVVIRSGIRNLRARLSYMRYFNFIDDIDNGELGYALSTFEAVLSYLAKDAGGLRKASRKNRKLWHATKAGNVTAMHSVLEPEAGEVDEDAIIDDNAPADADGISSRPSEVSLPDSMSFGGTTLNGTSLAGSLPPSSLEANVERGGSLSHVFPFQPPSTPAEDRPKARKRVSMETRSTSSSSGLSAGSFADTLGTHISGLDADTSIEKLALTQTPTGESVLMMAVSHGRDKALQYLLSLKTYYPLIAVLDDEDNDGTTLLSAAVQTGNKPVTDLLLDYITNNAENHDIIRIYLARQDSQGRCIAHYLFHYPHLISRVGRLVPWQLKDKNGQTPLFALCRSYDHEDYKWMVDAGLTEAANAQTDRQPLHLDDHIDNKGNSLLHIVNDPQMVVKLLYHCDADVNSANDKQFTPLMVASKFGRTDVVRVLFSDPRVDFYAKDQRGLTATELAKDDEVRNRIDDLVLLATPPKGNSRVTTVVRSFFVEDGSIRFIVKSGAQNPNSTITVTTCRRSLSDFETVSRLLALELPASWLPDITSFQSPFLMPSKPSRTVARDIQLRLDSFLKILLAHSTFATHEMVWEFFLVPDIDFAKLSERSKRKAETRAEDVRDEYEPQTDVREVELFVSYAKESVRSVHHSLRSVLRRTNRVRLAQNDFADANNLASNALNTLTFLPQRHKDAFARYTKVLGQTDFSPMAGFYYSSLAIASTTSAILTALNRPTSLIASMSAAQKSIERHASSLRRSDRWPLGLLDETRKSMQRDASEKMSKSEGEYERLAKELRYTQQVVAGELAAWQEERVKMGRRLCKDLARGMVVAERDRLEGMLRAVRPLGLEISKIVERKAWKPMGGEEGRAVTFLPKNSIATSGEDLSAGVVAPDAS